MRLQRFFGGIALLICTVAGVAVTGQTAAKGGAQSAAPATMSEVRARWVGTYRYAGSGEEQEARKAAIDRGVAGMSFLIRSTARGRISATTQILGAYTFSFAPGKIVVRPEARPEMISTDKGEPADYVYNGKTSRLTQVFSGDGMTQVFVSEDGRRENVYTLSEDGKVLRVKVTLTSPRLSTAVVYGLTYKRED